MGSNRQQWTNGCHHSRKDDMKLMIEVRTCKDNVISWQAFDPINLDYCGTITIRDESGEFTRMRVEQDNAVDGFIKLHNKLDKKEKRRIGKAYDAIIKAIDLLRKAVEQL